MRRVFDLNGTPGATGKPAQAASRKVAAMDRALGKGPLVNDGPNKVRVGSEKLPLFGTKATSAAVWGVAYAACAWDAFEGDSTDAIWTSSSVATIATMGWYELHAIIGMGVSATNKTVQTKWQKNDVDTGPVHEATSAFRAQAVAWEPYVRLNPGDTVRLMVQSEAVADTVRESRCTIRLVQELLGEKMLIKATGATVPYSGNADEVWLELVAASASIADTLTAVMTITGLPVGHYDIECLLVYQTTATTTGIDVAVNFTGTATWLGEARFTTTGGAAATAAASEATAAVTGNLYESQGSRTLNAIIGAGSVSVDAANTDMLHTIVGKVNVTAAGDLQIKLAAESAGLACTARPLSSLKLWRLS